jgi:arginyl-tRNA--protein-N-Asp/Glu arginylyltransferase
MLDDNLQILYCRIDLAKTDYSQLKSAKLIVNVDTVELRKIFKQYCDYKKFDSVEPMWDCEFTWSHNDVIGYYDSTKLVAWSVVTKYNSDDVYSVQFAWDYANPELRLGIKSIENECAYYKNLGYKYYYLGEAHKYKQNIKGFEILGPA